MTDMKKVYEMIANYKDEAIIYAMTDKGHLEHNRIMLLNEMLDDIDEDDDFEHYIALESLIIALNKVYEEHAINYVRDVMKDSAFNAYIEKYGWGLFDHD